MLSLSSFYHALAEKVMHGRQSSSMMITIPTRQTHGGHAALQPAGVGVLAHAFAAGGQPRRSAAAARVWS